jgi:Tol biopolymer transport system component
VFVVMTLVPTAEARPAARAAAGLQLLYSSDWPGHVEIYAVDPAGRLPTRQLTFGSCCGYTLPSISPDGKRIVFSSCTDAVAALFVARADGRSIRLLARVSKGCYAAGIAPAWSPDSKRIAYAIGGSLHVATATGETDRVIRAAGQIDSSGSDNLAWSTDGRSLALRTSAGALLVLRNGSLKSIGRAGEFTWSPTGRWIAYDRAEKGQYSTTTLVLVHPDGSGLRRVVVPYPGSGLEWSSDGRYVAFSTVRDGVGVLDVRRGRVRYLADDDSDMILWAPTGHRFASSTTDGITLYDVDTGTSRLLTSDEAYQAVWSPDGRFLAYVARSGFGVYISGDLRVVSLGGTVRTLVRANGDYGGFMGNLEWRPPAAGLLRPAFPRSVATVSSDQLVAPWTITALAADGGRIAYVSCGHVFAWTPATATVEQVEPVASATPACSLGQNYFAYQVYSVAVAGDRVAYAQVDGNTGQAFDLVASEAGASSELGAGIADGGDPLVCSGQCLGELVGSGGLLAYSAWNATFGTEPGPVITRQEIHRIDGIACPCATLRTGPGPLVPLDADGGRIVAGGDNATVIIDANGRQLLSVPIVPLAAALAGNDLVILRQGELLDLDATTGIQLHRWPLPDISSGRECGSKYCRPIWPDRPPTGPRLVLEDAAHGLAVYILDGQVHLLRLADGADATIGTGTLARFMGSGLVYADGNQLHLIPYDQLPPSEAR